MLLDEGDELVVSVEDVRREAAGAVRRGRAGYPSRPRGLADIDPASGLDGDDGDDGDDRDDDRAVGVRQDDGVRAEFVKAVGAARGPRLAARLADAGRAFRREQFADAARILRRLAEEAPGATNVRELYGLTLYRQEKWHKAIKELEAFRLATGSVEQHPVLADCYRAIERWSAVDALWAELKGASPSAALVVEGRIVTAAAKADRGELREALQFLQQGWRMPKRAQTHHLRRAYALADLFERAGEVAKARELFTWIAAREGDFADAKRRARQLR